MPTTELALAPSAPGTCCHPPITQAVDVKTARDLARVFKALSDPARVQLLAIVASHVDGEACVCDLTEPVGLAQPTVSHHLKILVDAGLLTREQRGRWSYYSLIPGALDQVSASLADVTNR